MEKITQIVEKLKQLNKTVSTMESCTSGSLASAFTNVDGASEILQFSAITYSNEFKIKMGVPAKVIDEFGVYSIETAIEMAKNITKFSNSDFGIGVTGKLNDDLTVYFCIYEKAKNLYYTDIIKVDKTTRIENKQMIIEAILKRLSIILEDL